MSLKTTASYLLGFLLTFNVTAIADTPPPVSILHIKGGTAEGAITAHSGLLSAVLPGASGNVLISNGVTWQSSPLSLPSLSATLPLSYNSGTGVFSIRPSNASQSGFLSAADWTTFNNKEPAITAGSSSQYFRGDKTFQPLTTAAIGGSLAGDVSGSLSSTAIATGAVTDTKASLATKPAVAAVATSNQALSGLPIVDGFQTAVNSLVLLTAQTTPSQNGPWTAQSGAWIRPTWYPSGGTTQAFQFITTLVRLGSTYSGTVWRNTTAAPITIDTTATTWVITKITLNASTATKATGSTDGFLSAADWTVFNAKLDASRFNYITNPDAEVDTAGWVTYDDSGRVASAYALNQDITWSSVATDNTGNGINVRYDFHATQPSSTPLVTVVSPTLITVAWYNGPTLANNPTATQLKAAFDAVPGATALATCTITGTAGNRQYIDGNHILANGGDAAPSNGIGGTPSNLTLTRTTSAPLVGNASFLEAKGATSQLGTGSSTDFTINSADKGNPVQVSFYYSGDAGMTFGSASDVKWFLLDVTNNVMLPLTRQTLTGTAGNIYRFSGQFTASSTSVSYRLIAHTATANATAWNLKFDSVTTSPTLDATSATQVPSVVLLSQPILGTVTDHMAVMWQDGNTSWRPATMAAGADASTLFGIATNIVGLTSSVTIRGAVSGFSFGPFAGYNQYVDSALAGGLSPSPATFTDTYVIMGKGISADTLMVEPSVVNRLVTSKGGLLTNAGANNGTGDQVLAAGANGNVLVANSAAALGVNWVPAVVAAAPFTYTLATRTLTAATATDSVAGFLSAADHTTYTGYAASIALKANLASPTFTGTPTLPTGSIGVTQTAGNSTTALATTAFVTTADNLKAPLASPTLTGTVNLPAINLINAATNGTNTILVYKDGHIKSTQTTAPTVLVSANAGTSATCTLTNSTDSGGIINLTEGSAAWASGTQCTITFNKAYGVAPICVFTPNNAATASHAVTQQVNLTTSTTTLVMTFGAAESAATAYKWMYYCMETQ